jgi:hypothetical protein
MIYVRGYSHLGGVAGIRRALLVGRIIQAIQLETNENHFFYLGAHGPRSSKHTYGEGNVFLNGQWFEREGCEYAP